MKLVDVPTEKFNQILNDLRREDWRTIEEYKGIDAWIDYGMIRLSRGNAAIKCEWTNWEEGVIVGPDSILVELKQHYGL